MRIFVFENGLKKAPTEYSRYLVYPYSAEYSHDTALGAASVTLRNMEREETFAPGTVVMIGDGYWTDNTLDQWVIVDTARGTNHASGKHTHTLYLCDITKLLEREVIGNKTFTRSMARGEIEDSKSFSATLSDTNIDFSNTNQSSSAFYCLTPSFTSPNQEKDYTLIDFSGIFPNYNAENGTATWTDVISVTVKLNGRIVRQWKYTVGTNYNNGVYEEIDGENSISGSMTLTDWISKSGIDVSFDSAGTVEIYWRVKKTKDLDNTRTVYMAYYRPDESNAEHEKQTLLGACQILARLSDMTRLSVYPSVRAIGAIAQKNMAEEIVDIDISNGTLREAIDTVAGVSGCFCRYKLEYDADVQMWDHYIDLHPISTTEVASVNALGSPVLQKMSDSIEGACSALDSTVSNLVTLSDSGTVCEPTDSAWTTLRSEEVRITEETAEIPTTYPIYRIDKVEVIYNDDSADITKYVYEKMAYDMLSSYAPAYPKSKAYALYYQRGQNSIKGLSFEQENAISQLLSKPSIVNICNAEFDSDYNDLGLGDGMLYYPRLRFRVTYVPITDTRVRQAKPDAADNAVPNVIAYNQSASYVDSVRYGRNMAGAAERAGQPGKTISYKTRAGTALPKPGLVYSPNLDYTISKVTVQRGKDVQTVQLNLARRFNRLNPFIGIDSAPRLFEISEQGYVDRNVIYEDFCIIGDKVGGDIDSLITADGVSGFAQSIISASASGRNTPTVAVTQGKSVLQDATLTTCVLPLDSAGIGRSLVYSFGYKDNYSAGDKAIAAEEYTNLYRLKEAVPYADVFGEIESLKINLATDSASGGIYADDLPEFDESATYTSVFAGTLPIYKDSRECIKVTYQMHFVTNKSDWILSPGMAEDFRMITRKSSALSRRIRLYRLSYQLSRTDTTIDLNRATMEYYTISSGKVATIPLQANTALKRVEMMPEVFGTYASSNYFTGGGWAWAVAYDDGKLLLGQNINTGPDVPLPNINFSFRHTVE